MYRSWKWSLHSHTIGIHITLYMYIMYLRISRLLAPPLLKIFLQLHLCLLQEVLDMFNLCLQLPQLGIECLETVTVTERNSSQVQVLQLLPKRLCTYLDFSISISFFSSSSFGSSPSAPVPLVKPVMINFTVN